jgi:hypothetical protein
MQHWPQNNNTFNAKTRKETFLPPILSLPVATVPVCSWFAIKKKESGVNIKQ